MLRRLFVGLLAMGAVLLSGAAQSDGHGGPIKVGVIATLEGTYTVLGEDGVRGFRTALAQFEGRAGGREIEVIIAASDASPDSALRAARKLVEQDEVDIIVGPLSGSEGIALRDYSKTQPQVTFVNGISGAQETTFVTPSENFFRFNMDGAQWSAGLGEYIYNELGYRRIATVGEDYSFIYTQVFGLVVEFCSLGGEVSERLWVPLGTTDFSSIIASLPEDVDAIYLGLGGGDALNFLTQYQQAGGDANLIGGTIMVDGTVLSAEGTAREALIGVPSAGPQADTWDNERWRAYVQAYQDTFPPEERFPSPSLLATGYYNAATAVFTVLDQIDGDLSDGHAKLRDGLRTLVLAAPNGDIQLDDNRQAIGTNFVISVIQLDNGDLATEVVRVVENVNQTLGIDPAAFAGIGLPSRDNPECKTSY